MEELDLKELFGFLKDKFALLITITLAVCMLGCFYTLLIQKPIYMSYTTVVLGGNETNKSESITQSDITLNKNLVDTYAEVVKSRRVLNQVIDSLNLDISYELLSKKVSVTSANDTEIIKIAVVDRNAKTAKNIANATASFFSREVVELYKLNNVNILDEAIESNIPYNINISKQVIIYFIFGLVLASGILFIIYYFDRTIKSTEQIEQKLKLPILGSIEKASDIIDKELIILDKPKSNISEDIRTIRTNLNFISTDKESRAIEFCCDKFKIPRILIKIPYYKI